MKQALVSVDFDFFTKPYYKGCHYENSDWVSKSDFKAKANKWIHTEDFISKLPIDEFIRGCIVQQDQQPLFHWANLINTHWVEKKKFDIIYFDAHHDMYMWNDAEYYLAKDGIAAYSPFEAMLAPLQLDWAENIIWVHPDYVDTKLPDLSFYPNVNVKSIQWSDWQWGDYEIKYLTVITNPDISIINQGMIEDFTKIMHVW